MEIQEKCKVETKDCQEVSYMATNNTLEARLSI